MAEAVCNMIAMTSRGSFLLRKNIVANDSPTMHALKQRQNGIAVNIFLIVDVE